MFDVTNLARDLVQLAAERAVASPDRDFEEVLHQMKEDFFCDLSTEMADKSPRRHRDGYVVYRGVAYFYDWSGDLSYSPILADIDSPDYANSRKVEDDAVSEELYDVIQSLIA